MALMQSLLCCVFVRVRVCAYIVSQYPLPNRGMCGGLRRDGEI